MGNQTQNSAKSSHRNEGQKYINVLPRSNPTGTISSIQDRFNGANSSSQPSQKNSLGAGPSQVNTGPGTQTALNTSLSQSSAP